jgi:WD40 repeat protein
MGLVVFQIGFFCVAADNLVKIWSPFTGELIRNLSGHTKGLSDIAWSADGVYLASASDDTSIRIWNVDSVGRQLGPLSSNGLILRNRD